MNAEEVCADESGGDCGDDVAETEGGDGERHDGADDFGRKAEGCRGFEQGGEASGGGLRGGSESLGSDGGAGEAGGADSAEHADDFCEEDADGGDD